MKERVPTFGQKERNGPIVKERNGERNGVPNFKEREERGKFGKFLGEKCKNMRKFSKFKLFLGRDENMPRVPRVPNMPNMPTVVNLVVGIFSSFI